MRFVALEFFAFDLRLCACDLDRYCGPVFGAFFDEGFVDVSTLLPILDSRRIVASARLSQV